MVKKFFKYYFRTVKFAMRYKWLYFMSIFFTLLLLFFNNYAIFLLRDLVNAIQANTDIYRPLLTIGLVIAAPIVLLPATFQPKRYIYAKVVGDIMSAVYKKVMSLDYEFHTNQESGKLLSKIMNSDMIPIMYFWSLEYWIVNSLASFFIPIVLLSFISKEMALLILIAIILTIPFQIWGAKWNIKRRYELKESEYARNSAIIDGVTNYETVRIFGRGRDEVNYLTSLMKDNVLKIFRYQNTFTLIDFTSRVGGILVFITGVVGIYYLRARLDAGSLVVIVSFLIQIANSLMSLVFSVRDVLKNTPLIEDVFELLDQKPKFKEPTNPRKLTSPKGKIEFKDVGFAYRKGHKVFSGININIKPSQTIAFVGTSGGGKSTLVRLLLRYYCVKEGKILIDGIDINKLGTENINQLMGIVPQEPILFNRSIKYNIGYALSPSEEEISQNMEKVIEAAKKAQIYEFIKKLPEGFDTVVGERGIKLSGGQKQRVAIARVILKNPKIVIFDEATSMLDSESEMAIQKAFKEVSKNATTIIIAHRLSTIRNVDKIFVIDKGGVVESGTHKSLVKKNGEYAKLWELQSGGFSKIK